MAEFTATERRQVTVDLSDEEIIKYLIKRAFRKVDMPENYYLRDDNIVCREVHTSHSWEQEIGPATPEQLNAFAFIKAVRETLQG